MKYYSVIGELGYIDKKNLKKKKKKKKKKRIKGKE